MKYKRRISIWLAVVMVIFLGGYFEIGAFAQNTGDAPPRSSSSATIKPVSYKISVNVKWGDVYPAGLALPDKLNIRIEHRLSEDSGGSEENKLWQKKEIALIRGAEDIRGFIYSAEILFPNESRMKEDRLYALYSHSRGYSLDVRIKSDDYYIGRFFSDGEITKIQNEWKIKGDPRAKDTKRVSLESDLVISPFIPISFSQDSSTQVWKDAFEYRFVWKRAFQMEGLITGVGPHLQLPVFTNPADWYVYDNSGNILDRGVIPVQAFENRTTAVYLYPGVILQGAESTPSPMTEVHDPEVTLRPDDDDGRGGKGEVVEVNFSAHDKNYELVPFVEEADVHILISPDAHIPGKPLGRGTYRFEGVPSSLLQGGKDLLISVKASSGRWDWRVPARNSLSLLLNSGNPGPEVSPSREPEALPAVFLFPPKLPPGFDPSQIQLGYKVGSVTKLLGEFSAQGRLVTKVTPGRSYPLLFKKKGEEKWIDSSLLLQDANLRNTVIDVNPDWFVPADELSLYVVATTDKGGSRATGTLKFYVGDEVVATQEKLSVPSEENKISVKLPQDLNGKLIRVVAQVPGYRQIEDLSFKSVQEIREKYQAGFLYINFAREVSEAEKGVALIIDPALRWKNFSQIRNAISDEIKARVGSPDKLKGPIILGTVGGYYDYIDRKLLEDDNFDLYSFLSTGFRSAKQTTGMSSAKSIAKLLVAGEGEDQLLERLKTHGGWNIIIVVPNNFTDSGSRELPPGELEAIKAAAKAYNAKTLLIEEVPVGGGNSNTPLYKELSKLLGEDSLYEYQPREDAEACIKLIRSELQDHIGPVLEESEPEPKSEP